MKLQRAVLGDNRIVGELGRYLIRIDRSSLRIDGPGYDGVDSPPDPEQSAGRKMFVEQTVAGVFATPRSRMRGHILPVGEDWVRFKEVVRSHNLLSNAVISTNSTFIGAL
jgi:hypothetical protein